MAFTSQTFTERGVGGGGITSTADSLMYVRREDYPRIAAAWGLHKPVIVPVLDTEGLPAMVMFANNASGRGLDYRKLSTDPMVTEALRTGRTSTLYTVGWFLGQPTHYYSSGNGVHVEMVNPYVDNRDIVPKAIAGGDSIHEGYVPFGLYSSAAEYDSSSYLDMLSAGKDAQEDAMSQRDEGKTFEQLVGDPFTRDYDAPGIDPSMYWLGDDV